MNPPALKGGTSTGDGCSPGLLLALAAICLVAGLTVVSSVYLNEATGNGAKAVGHFARDARLVEATCGGTVARAASEPYPAQRSRLLSL